ncbi:hypothetical protein BT69DRAFT_1285736, partial [Atractiella rhizophila]
KGNINSVEGSDYERGNCQIQIHGGEKRKRIIRNDATAILVFHPWVRVEAGNMAPRKTYHAKEARTRMKQKWKR